jgi:tetratricopeptide (TPR) repeat protein
MDSIKVAENLEITRSFWNNLTPYLKSNYYSDLLINVNGAGRERIEEILDIYLDEIKDPSEIKWFPVAEAYYTIGDLDKAMESLEAHKFYNNDSTSALYCHTYAIINDMAGNISEALDGYKGYFKATDRIHGSAYTSNVRFIEERYRNEIELNEARHKKERIQLLGIIGLLSAVTVIFLIQRKLNIRTNEKKQLEIERLKLEQLYADAEAEKEALSQMLENVAISPDMKDMIFKRLEILNTIVVSHLSARDSDIRKAREKLEELISDRNAFIQSTRMTIDKSCPEFLRKLQTYGLDNDEIDICCLYAIGMKGKDIKTYTGQSRLYIQSAGIRHKLGLEESDTNLSIYIRDMFSAS